MDFPIFKTKINSDKVFDLTDPASRRAYFEYKAGPEIKKIRDYLRKNTFIVYLLGKKSSGKGTYAKMLKEIIDPQKIEHVSIGDMIRSFDSALKDPIKKQELVDFLYKKYRGSVSVQEVIKAMEARSTKALLPSELILALTEREISTMGKKSIFLDGFPRDLDQVSYALFFKNLIDYRNDPDIFVLIDVPTNVIDERIKYRLVCPRCNTSRNLKLLPTRDVGYDEKSNLFYLICDNSNCDRAKMVTKEGDELGIEPIRTRLDKDGVLMGQIYAMHGIQKIFLRNSIPLDMVKENYDDYEITPEYEYSYEAATGKVLVKQKPWQVEDDEGNAVNSLMPPPVVISLIKQLVKVLGI